MVGGGERMEHTLTDEFTYERARKLVRDAQTEDGIKQNPVTGGRWVHGLDDERYQIRIAAAALHAKAAREHDLPPGITHLPLSPWEWEKIKGPGATDFLVSLYARSLANCDYSAEHPIFRDFACSTVASGLIPDWVVEGAIVKGYPPVSIVPIGPGAKWIRPFQHHDNTRQL
jgi:hypothetical protein